MKRLIILMLIVSTASMSFSQDVKFGKVTKEELMETSYPQDTSANAAMLYKYRNSYFMFSNSGIEIITEVQVKLKVYNKQGFDYATKEIMLFKSGSSRERISKIKAYTYNLENDKIVKTELKKDQIFKSEYSKNINQVKFTMPNVKEGSVIEYKYRITSPRYLSIDEFVFQYDIPIKYAEAYLKTPEGVNFKPTQKGYVNFMTKKGKTNISGVTMDMDEYRIHNIPALKEEEFVDNIRNYRAGVMYELVSITIPGERPRSFAQTWSDVAKMIGNTDDYEKQLDKTKSFDDKLKTVLAGVVSKEDKMKAIFKYVKEHIKWNGNDGKYFQYGIKKALKEKKGNAADINLTLVAMLRYAGIEANPLVISTKDNAIPFFPTLDRLNYVIAYAQINDKDYVMDATDDFSDINILPVRDYNWQGIYINNTKMVWQQLPIKKPKQAISQCQIKAKLLEDGEMEGTYKSRLTGHYSYVFRNKVKDLDMETITTNRESEFDDIEISDYSLKNYDTYEGNISEEFNYYVEDAAEQIDGKLYIKPMGFLAIEDNPFKSETRLYPIDFGFAFKDAYIISLEIPEGYQCESELKPFAMKTPDGNVEFKYIPSMRNNVFSLMVQFNVKKAIHGAKGYEILREVFNQVIKKEGEQITFKKI